MPYETQWMTWPTVWLRDDMRDFLGSENFHTLSIMRRQPGLSGGLCFGAAVRWYRRIFDRPQETPLDRITHLATHLESAAAAQFLHKEVLQAMHAATNRLVPWDQYCEYLNSICSVSRLNFIYIGAISGPECSSSIMRIMAELKCDHFYYFKLTCIYDPPRNPPRFNHGVALMLSHTGPSKFFDTNLGEFAIGKNQFTQFLFDYLQNCKQRGFTISGSYIFEVTEGAGLLN